MNWVGGPQALGGQVGEEGKAAGDAFTRHHVPGCRQPARGPTLPALVWGPERPGRDRPPLRGSHEEGAWLCGRWERGPRMTLGRQELKRWRWSRGPEPGAWSPDMAQAPTWDRPGAPRTPRGWDHRHGRGRPRREARVQVLSLRGEPYCSRPKPPLQRGKGAAVPVRRAWEGAQSDLAPGAAEGRGRAEP